VREARDAPVHFSADDPFFASRQGPDDIDLPADVAHLRGLHGDRVRFLAFGCLQPAIARTPG